MRGLVRIATIALGVVVAWLGAVLCVLILLRTPPREWFTALLSFYDPLFIILLTPQAAISVALVVLAETIHERRIRPYIIGGLLLTTVPVLLSAGIWWQFVLAALPGLVAGSLYWVIAGRSAGCAYEQPDQQIA